MLTYLNGISVATILFYVLVLILTISLLGRHNPPKAGGWLFLLCFAVLRLIAAGLQLATIKNPDNPSLPIGFTTVQMIGIAPLEIAALCLLSSVIKSINKAGGEEGDKRRLPFPPLLTGIIIFVGFILGIVGGVKETSEFKNSGVLVTKTESKVAIGLFLVCFALIVLGALTTSIRVSPAKSSEKHLLIAIAVSLPFFLVRLVYSSIQAFGHDADFGSDTEFLCMAFLMEVAVVLIWEVTGLLGMPEDGFTVKRFTVRINGRLETVEQTCPD
ncbi:hypothetical protein EG329_000707 [Mollisiaceae sp. DMI_Dod_QoI]|nr:hypothetical protein EG329_000707 [Helotiales sp. DMI_Dod_QoI]